MPLRQSQVARRRAAREAAPSSLFSKFEQVLFVVAASKKPDFGRRLHNSNSATAGREHGAICGSVRLDTHLELNSRCGSRSLTAAIKYARLRDDSYRWFTARFPAVTGFLTSGFVATRWNRWAINISRVTDILCDARLVLGSGQLCSF